MKISKFIIFKVVLKLLIIDIFFLIRKVFVFMIMVHIDITV